MTDQGIGFMVFHCFIKEEREIYRMLFNSSKTNDHSQVIPGRWSMLMCHRCVIVYMCNSIAREFFILDFEKVTIGDSL